MATDEILPPTLLDLPTDVLSILLFQLSAKDILSLSLTAKHVSKKIKLAMRLARDSAYSLSLKSTPSPVVSTFIQTLDRAIEFSHRICSLDITYPSIKSQVENIMREYGYTFGLDQSVSGTAGIIDIVHAANPNNIYGDFFVTIDKSIKFFFHWFSHSCHCSIHRNGIPTFGSKDEYTFNDLNDKYETISKCHSLYFSRYVVERASSYSKQRTPGTCIEVTEDASWTDVIQAARDYNAIYRLYERWGMPSAIHFRINPRMALGMLSMYKRVFAPFVESVKHFGDINLLRLLYDLLPVIKCMENVAKCDFTNSSARTWSDVLTGKCSPCTWEDVTSKIYVAVAPSCTFGVLRKPKPPDNDNFRVRMRSTRLEVTVSMKKEPYQVLGAFVKFLQLKDFAFSFEFENGECKWIYCGYSDIYDTSNEE